MMLGCKGLIISHNLPRNVCTSSVWCSELLCQSVVPMTSRFVNNLIAALLLGFRTEFVQLNVLRHTAAVVYVKELFCTYIAASN